MWRAGDLGQFVIDVIDKSTIAAELIQLLLQLLSSPMKPAHYGTDWNIKDFCDFFVGKSLYVGEKNGCPVLVRQLFEGVDDVAIGDLFEQYVFGASPDGCKGVAS